jgi:hypothetical protein
MANPLTPAEILKKLSDPDIRRLYQRAIGQHSRAGASIDKREIEGIFKEVLLDKWIDKKETADLALLLEYAQLAPNIKRHLRTLLFNKEIQIARQKRRRLSGNELRDVVYVLRKHTRGLKFTNPKDNITYSERHYDVIGERILRGAIRVFTYVDRTSGAIFVSEGHYRGLENELYIRHPYYDVTSDGNPDPHLKALNFAGVIVHEVTHAVQDWMDLRISPNSSEADAYLASALCLWNKFHVPVGGEHPFAVATHGPARIIQEAKTSRKALDHVAYRLAYNELRDLFNKERFRLRNGEQPQNLGRDRRGKPERRIFDSLLRADSGSETVPTTTAAT